MHEPSKTKLGGSPFVYRGFPPNSFRMSCYYLNCSESSTAACAAANFDANMLIFNDLRLDWSTFELQFSCILHVLHVDVSYYFVRIFIILQNIQFFLQEYPFT